MYKGKVAITTFFYKHQAYAEYCKSLAQTVALLCKNGIEHIYWPVHGAFHMEVAVNLTLSVFMNQDEIDDIVIIDSDESWNPEHFLRLLSHPVDIVCGVYRLTTPDDMKFPVIPNIAEDGSFLGVLLEDGNCLLEAKRIPAGFTKINKRALKKWSEDNPDNWIKGDKDSKVDKIYNFFLNEIRNNDFHGMDFCFTDKMIRSGFKVWIDPVIEVTHYGIYPYSGTLDKHLRDLKAKQDAEKEAKGG